MKFAISGAANFLGILQKDEIQGIFGSALNQFSTRLSTDFGDCSGDGSLTRLGMGF
jgi:hypothetical protein